MDSKKIFIFASILLNGKFQVDKAPFHNTVNSLYSIIIFYFAKSHCLAGLVISLPTDGYDNKDRLNGREDAFDLRIEEPQLVEVREGGSSPDRWLIPHGYSSEKEQNAVESVKYVKPDCDKPDWCWLSLPNCECTCSCPPPSPSWELLEPLYFS